MPRKQSREEIREKARKYRESHKEQIRESASRYLEKNREYLYKCHNLQQRIRYREDHEYRARLNASQKAYRLAHPEVMERNRARSKAWRDKRGKKNG